MCGIAGFNFKNKALIKRMTDAMQHRGPDAAGSFADERATLGHRRLAILDLSEKGKQPMHYKHFTITYNGEMYNFQTLRNELRAQGHEFVSETDTEVILHAYDEWGADCVNRFNGMWAFCIYDQHKEQLFLSRDRYGIKPLYYVHKNGQFAFASELKALRLLNLSDEINKYALNFYYYQKYIGGSHSIYADVHKLLPAHNMLFDLTNSKLKISKYYDLQSEVEKAQKMPLEERLEQIEQLCDDAVQARLIADVPVGAFLSGGLDSSLISALIARKKRDFDTFSIGFKEKTFNELEFSKIVAEHIGTKHHYDTLEVDEDLMRFVIGRLDEPFGDASLLPTYLLSKITRKHVTVSLSGDAGDELFGGYDSYKAHRMARYAPGFAVGLARNFAHWLPVSDKKLPMVFKARKFFDDFHPEPVRRHLNWMSQTNNQLRRKLLGANFLPDEGVLPVENGKDLLFVQLNDMNNYLAEDILKKVDIATMLNSLEARVPFLDYRLVPLALSLPESLKIKRLETKWLLKKMGEKYLPKDIIYRKKRGFSVPVSRWVKSSAFMQGCLTNEKYYKHALINRKNIINLLKAHKAGQGDYSRPLWLTVVFNYWWVQQA